MLSVVAGAEQVAFPRLVTITRRFDSPSHAALFHFPFAGMSVAYLTSPLHPAMHLTGSAHPRPLDSIPGGRRVPRNKDFLNKHGHRHHSFDPEKAPYPLSYDRQVLEL